MSRHASCRRKTWARGHGYEITLMLAGLAGAVMPQAAASPFECLIEPNQVIEVRSSVEGLIGKVHVQRGDNVKKGQVLVELDSEVERSTVEAAKYRAKMTGRIESAQNRLEYTNKKLQRATELHSQNFVAAQQRDDAETEKNLAEAELKDAVENRDLAKLDYRRAEDLLNLRTLRSPFDGLVIDRLLNPGDLAESGTGRKPILKIAQINPLRVEVILPQALSGRLRVGMSGEVRPEHGTGKFIATIKVVDRVMDAASGTFGVRLELLNSLGAVPAGVRCQIEFPDVKGAEENLKRIK